MADTLVSPSEHRNAQISPDRFGVGVAAIILVAIIMLASMVFSYVSIAEAGQWTFVPYGMHWLAPIFIDGAILTYTVSLAIFESRKEDRSTISRTRGILWGFTGLSVVVNFAHAASGWQWNFTILEAWIGCIIAISAPIAALLSAEEVVRLAFKRKARTSSGEAPVPVPVPAVTETAQAPEPARASAPPAVVADAENENESDDLAILVPDVQETSDPNQIEHGEQITDLETLRRSVLTDDF